MSQVVKKRTLLLPLKRKWWDQIKSGTKVEEFRLANAYWTKRLEGRTYDEVILTLGYPTRDDLSRRIVLPWRGVTRKRVVSDEWQGSEREVFAIRLTAENAGHEENLRLEAECPYCEKGRDANDGPYSRACTICKGTNVGGSK